MEVIDRAEFDALREVLSKADPHTVLSLCQASTRFAKLCRKQETFAVLMDLHYPDVKIDRKNPKMQYMKLTAERGLEYHVHFDRRLEEEEGTFVEDSNGEMVDIGARFERLAYRNQPETFKEREKKYHRRPNAWRGRSDYHDHSGAIFTIYGTRIRTGDVVAVVVEIDQSNDRPTMIGAVAYDNIHDAVQAYVEDNYEDRLTSYVLQFYEEVHDGEMGVVDEALDDNYRLGLGRPEIEILLEHNVPVPYHPTNAPAEPGEWTYKEILKEFEDWMVSKGHISPFTMENVHEYIEANGFIVESFGLTQTAIQFIEVELEGFEYEGDSEPDNKTTLEKLDRELEEYMAARK